MKMFLLLIALSMLGCASSPVDLTGGYVNNSNGFATIADANDPIDMAAAPVVTRLALYANTAANLADADKLSRPLRDQIRIREMLMRDDIEDAIRYRKLEKIQAASTQLDEYLNELRAIK